MSTDGQLSDAQGQAAVSTDEGPDEFDLAMDELASGTTPPADDAAGQVAVDPSDDASGGTDLPPGSDAEAGTSGQAAGTEPPAGDQSTDIWANVPEEVRAAHRAALRDQELRYNSVVGRLSAADRQLAQLRREQQPPAQEGQPQPAPQQQGGGADPFSGDTITRLREDYGEVAGPLVDMIAALKGKVDQLEAPVQQIGQERHAAQLNAQEQFLAGQHADWLEVAKDERFHGWVQTQPRFIQEALNRNANAIVDGQEAARIIGMFKQEIGAGATPPPPPAPAADPAPTPQLDPRRQRQLLNGRDAGKPGAPVTSGIPDDFDSAMEAYIAKAESAGRL